MQLKDNEKDYIANFILYVLKKDLSDRETVRLIVEGIDDYLRSIR